MEQIKSAELDEMWSFVQNKKNQRWLWLAIDHKTHVVLAYTFGQRKDKVFNELKCLLEPFGICTFYTDNCGSYERNLDSEKYIVGKRNTQAIERKKLTFRTRIKRLCRKTICFSKSIIMHDIIIGLVINILEFGWTIKTHFQRYRMTDSVYFLPLLIFLCCYYITKCTFMPLPNFLKALQILL